MQIENSQDLPISDSLRDDMLFKIIGSDPWYANIINFIVVGYVPPGENKRKLVYRVVSIYRMHCTSSKSALTVYSGDVYR
jgi:hypothetical protein